MKHLITLIAVAAIVAPGFAHAESCTERRTEIEQQAEAIGNYPEDIANYIESLPKEEQSVANQELQAAYQDRMIQLEQSADAYVASCVK